MVVIDQWIKSAILDTTLVADLLLRLKHSSIPKSPPLFSHWGAKKPRSSVSRSKHHRSSTAFSPTTPLSWTGSADGYEHSSRSKTFVVEEESSLIKERIYLTKDIENEKATSVAHGAGNQSLKRRKLDLGSGSISCDKPNSSADEHLSTLPRIVHSTSKAVANAAHEVNTLPRETRFVLPDLNMMPPTEEEEDSCANFPYGRS